MIGSSEDGSHSRTREASVKVKKVTQRKGRKAKRKKRQDKDKSDWTTNKAVHKLTQWSHNNEEKEEDTEEASLKEGTTQLDNENVKNEAKHPGRNLNWLFVH